MNIARMVKAILLLALVAAGFFVAAREWKQNTAGLPEHDPEGKQASYGAGDALEIPVRFK